MQVDYTGRQVTITPQLRGMAQEGVERVARILGSALSIHVVLAAEKYRQLAEITVKMRLHTIIGEAESNSLESALREAIARTETQAKRHKQKQRTRKRVAKDEKQIALPALSRGRRHTRPAAEGAPAANLAARQLAMGEAAVPSEHVQGRTVTVHSFPAKQFMAEPHVISSSESLAVRPMTVEEAVKEAEFRDRDIFIFRDHQGRTKVLHRKRDGKMELIEIP